MCACDTRFGSTETEQHNYRPAHIMKLDQFVRSGRDYDSIF